MMQNFVLIGQNVTETWPFFLFLQKGGRPTSWICYVHVWTTHEEHLVIFKTVKKIGWNRCSSCDKKKVMIFNEFGLKMPTRASKWRFFGGQRC